MNTFTDYLRVAALPLDIKWGRKEANLAAVSEAFTHLPKGTDIVVLPELFSTGYADDIDALTELAERNTGATIDYLKALAARYSVAVAGSYLAFTPPHLYNRGFFIEPNGDFLRQAPPLLGQRRGPLVRGRYRTYARGKVPGLERVDDNMLRPPLPRMVPLPQV